MDIIRSESNPKMRILFVTANRVGDAVLSSGLLAHLADKYPGARITIAAGPAAAALFRNAPCLERLIVLEKMRYSFHWLRLWFLCITTRWDIIIDLRRSALAYLLFAGRRYVIPKPRREMHRVELLATTIPGSGNSMPPALWPDNVGTELAEYSPIVAIGPAANWVGKQWRGDRFAALAQRLVADDGPFPGGRIAVFAATSERNQADPVLTAIPEERVLDLVGVGDLAAVAGYLRRCAFFVGNDSGLMHMAAAAGIPTLGLFGPSRTEHYAPWGENCDFVRTPESYDELVGAPGYDHRTTGTLMDGLSVDAVMAACTSLAAKTRQSAK